MLSSGDIFGNIISRIGKKTFACARFFDHAAKENQSRYPWAQNIVSIGLLKVIKGRWACLPLSFRLYHQQKEIKNKRMDYRGRPIDFQNKLQSMKVLVAL